MSVNFKSIESINQTEYQQKEQDDHNSCTRIIKIALAALAFLAVAAGTCLVFTGQPIAGGVIIALGFGGGAFLGSYTCCTTQQKTAPIATKPVSTAAKIAVGTYNILYPQPWVDPLNPPEKMKNDKFEKIGYSFNKETKKIEDNYVYRAGVVADNILKANLDVVCLQEVTNESIEILKKKLTDYEFVWDRHNFSTSKTCREKKFGSTVNHGVAIIYKKAGTTLLDKKIERSLIKLRKSQKSRVHVRVDLSLKGKNIRVVTGHFVDSRSFDKGEKDTQIKKALELASEKSQHVFDLKIVAGDKNQDQWGQFEDQQKTADVKHAEAFQSLLKDGYQFDGNYQPTEFDKDFTEDEAKKDPSVYNKTATELISLSNKEPRKIDWIFGNGDGVTLEPIDLSACSITGSDHRLVGTNFVWA